MEIFLSIINTFEIQTIIRLFLGFVLAGFIGAEREWMNKPAGFKTHSLIGVSAVLIMLCGEYLSEKYNVDASRIPAQLLSGIGFIGAGTILNNGFNVKGLTTAASLLIVTCIGLCIGAGFYLPAIIGAGIAYCILEYSYKLQKRMEHFVIITYFIKLKDYKQTIEKIENILEQNECSIKNIKDRKYKENNENEKTEIEIAIKLYKNSNSNKIIKEISKLDEVIEIEEM